MIILDTNVVSELMRPSPDHSVVEWFAQQPATYLYISTVSEAELRYGVEILPTGQRRDRLRAGVEAMLDEDFAGRVLPFDRSAAFAYALIATARRAAGQPISHADCQIAAIARSLNVSVATRDVNAFQGCGIEVINPWSPEDAQSGR